MDFPFGFSVVRQRRKTMIDPYSLKTVAGNWDNPETASIVGAFVNSSSSVASSDPVRSQVTTTKSLFGDPNAFTEDDQVTVADVRVGDRIVADGHTYTVEALPSSDINPFTGWQPVKEIPLVEVLG